MRRLWVMLGIPLAGAGLAIGCQRSTDGSAVLADDAGTAPAPATTATPIVTPGVAETLSDTAPPNALTCLSPPTGLGDATPATVADPAAPRLTISVPAGWNSSPGTGAVALTLRGPDGLSGTVSVKATSLDPAEAFAQYSEELAERAAVSVVNVRPAEFCGYSSQELSGTRAEPPAEPVEFADRITHIWTNTDTYLVVVHLQAPVGAPGFDDAKTTLMQEFTVVIP